MLPIKNLKEVKNEGNVNVNMVIYGDSGVGKTTFASTAAADGKVLYIDSEAGANFIDDKYADNIDLLKLDNINLLDEVLKPENIKEYKTVVLDSVTEIMKKMVDKIKGSKDKPSLADWGTVITNMETYFRRFRDLDKNVIMVALTQEKVDEDMILKRPSLSGKNLPADIIGLVDICLFIENTAAGRIAHTQPSTKFYAKDRTKTLPDKILQDELNCSFIFNSCKTKPKQVSEEQIKEIEDGFKTLGLSEEIIAKTWSYGDATSKDDLSFRGAEKILELIRKKITK